MVMAIKVFKLIKRFLAITGAFGMAGSLIAAFFILKSYNYPPHIIVQKVLKRIHLDNNFISEALEPDPVKPLAIKFPDPGDTEWNGHGARKGRKLYPVIFQDHHRPVPKQWLGTIHKGPYTEGIYGNNVTVTDTRSFISAIKRAKPGDEIILAPGIYQIKSYNIAVSTPGERLRPIRVKARQLGQARIELNSAEGFLVSSPYWIFENLDIKGINTTHDYGEHAFHVVGNAKGFVLRNCRVHDFNSIIKANGTRGEDGKIHFPDNALIENNSFYNSTVRRTSNPVNAIDVVGADNWIINGNFIADFQKGEGDTISYAAFVKGNASNTVFENNLVIGEYRHTGGIRVGISLGGGGSGKKYARNNITRVEHTNAILRNNVIMYCKDAGIYLNKSTSTKIQHNLLYNTMGIDVRFKTSTAIIENNILTSRVAERDGGKAILKNNITAGKNFFGSTDMEKWFNNPQIADFSLNADAPLINKAHVIPGIFVDMCGRQRDEKPDIGPFEYKANGGCVLIDH